MKFGKLHGYVYLREPLTVGHKLTDKEIKKILKRANLSKSKRGEK